MKILNKSEYPGDLLYHRNSSPIYQKYLHLCGLATFPLRNPYQFAWIKKVFGNWFTVIKYERTDEEPNMTYLKSTLGVKHALVVWIPYSKIPTGWRKLWFSEHFEETGYSRLNYSSEITKKIDPPYLLDWNDRARRARKKYLSSGCIIKEVSPVDFVEAFRKTKVRGPHKNGSIIYYNKFVKLGADKIRQWIAYDSQGRSIAGLAVHDYCEDHTVHLVAFTDKEAYASQAGTGLIDIWFASSYEKKFKYISFDHLRNGNGPRDQKGYTEFKENFLTARLSFKDAYFRFF